MTTLPHRFEEMIQSLENLVRVGQTGKLAGLRRGVNKPPGLVPEAYSQVAPFLDPGPPTWKEESAYHTATLFAWWYQGRNALAGPLPYNLGASFRLLTEKDLERRKEKEKNDSLEKRFMALLKARPEALPHHLRQAVGLLKSKDVPINWRQLLQDLLYWKDPNHSVQRGWSKSFWAPDRDKTKNKVDIQ